MKRSKSRLTNIEIGEGELENKEELAHKVIEAIYKGKNLVFIEEVEISEKDRKKLMDKLIKDIQTGESTYIDLEFLDNAIETIRTCSWTIRERYVIKRIGESTYIDLEFLTEMLTKEEADYILEEIRQMKKTEKVLQMTKDEWEAEIEKN